MMPDASTWMLFLIAIVNMITASLVLMAKRDINKIEIATNSMKDALVAATAKASKAEGKAEQRAETEAGNPVVPIAPKPPYFGILREKDRD